MNKVQWWADRLKTKKEELAEHRDVVLGSQVDKLKATIDRLDLVQQIALLERNLARSRVEEVTEELGSLLAIIHKDSGQLTSKLGLEASIEEAVKTILRERAELEELNCFRKLAAVTVSHETRADRGEPAIRVPRQGLVCVSGCSIECIRVSGDMTCEKCERPYRQHPYCSGQVTYATGVPEYFLHVDCEGRHLKL